MTQLMLAAAFGTLSGMRTFSGPLFASLLRTLNEDESGVFEDRLNGKTPVAVLGALALAEVIGDKLPGTGDRASAGPLLGRVLAGALAGVLVCRDDDPERVAMMAATGAGSAIGSTIAAFGLRRTMRDHAGIPDVILGAVEDLVVYGSGGLLLQQLLDE